MTPLCTRICPCPLFEATPPGAAPGPRLKLGPVFVAPGGVTSTRPRSRRQECAGAPLPSLGVAARGPSSLGPGPWGRAPMAARASDDGGLTNAEWSAARLVLLVVCALWAPTRRTDVDSARRAPPCFGGAASANRPPRGACLSWSTGALCVPAVVVDNAQLDWTTSAVAEHSPGHSSAVFRCFSAPGPAYARDFFAKGAERGGELAPASREREKRSSPAPSREASGAKRSSGYRACHKTDLRRPPLNTLPCPPNFSRRRRPRPPARRRSQPRAHGCTPAVYVWSRGELPKTVDQSLRCGLRVVVKTTEKLDWTGLLRQ